MESDILVSIDLSNGLLPVRLQTIAWSNTVLFTVGHLVTYASEILCKIQTISLKKIHLKCLQNGSHFVQASFLMVNSLVPGKF